MVAKVFPTPVPPASDLELCKVWGANDVWALQCKNPAFIGRDVFSFAPLPLPHLSVPLFLDYGVGVRRLGLLPWKVHSKVLQEAGWDAKLKPRSWRTLLLNAGYV